MHDLVPLLLLKMHQILVPKIRLVIQDLSVRKKRKYNVEYIKLGFTWIGDENEPKRLCNECVHVMHKSSLNPSKLKRHSKQIIQIYKTQLVSVFKDNLMS